MKSATMTAIAALSALLAIGAGCPGAAADKPDDPGSKTAQPTVEKGSPQSPDARPVPAAEAYGRVCATCHGAEGDGQGLEQELFSFATPAAGWTNGPTVEGIVKTLGEGIHETSMRPFPDYGVEKRHALAAYVLELRKNLLERPDEAGEGPETR